MALSGAYSQLSPKTGLPNGFQDASVPLKRNKCTPLEADILEATSEAVYAHPLAQASSSGVPRRRAFGAGSMASAIMATSGTVKRSLPHFSPSGSMQSDGLSPWLWEYGW